MKEVRYKSREEIKAEADAISKGMIRWLGKKGWKKSFLQGYGVDKCDFVKVAGKTYFRHSAFFNEFERSKHNHWVFQVFSFDKKGAMKCSNGDFGKLFPAVTIYHTKPRFWQIELTRRDLKKIAAGTQPAGL